MAPFLLETQSLPDVVNMRIKPPRRHNSSGIGVVISTVIGNVNFHTTLSQSIFTLHSPFRRRRPKPWAQSYLEPFCNHPGPKAAADRQCPLDIYPLIIPPGAQGQRNHTRRLGQFKQGRQEPRGCGGSEVLHKTRTEDILEISWT